MSAIVTELELQTKGASDAVNELNHVAESSQRLNTGIGGLERGLSKLAGSNREAQELFRGLSEAMEAAEHDSANFISIIGDTAVFTGAAVAIGLITENAKDLNKEINELNEKAGHHGKGGFFGFLDNMITGIKGLLPETETDRAIRVANEHQAKWEASENKENGGLTPEQEAANRKRFTDEAVKEYRKESTPESIALENTEKWASGLGKVADLHGKIQRHYADELDYQKELKREAEVNRENDEKWMEAVKKLKHEEAERELSTGEKELRRKEQYLHVEEESHDKFAGATDINSQEGYKAKMSAIFGGQRNPLEEKQASDIAAMKAALEKVASNAGIVLSL